MYKIILSFIILIIMSSILAHIKKIYMKSSSLSFESGAQASSPDHCHNRNGSH